MAQMKRSQAQREADFVVTARMYLQQRTQQEIADYICTIRDYNISRTQIAYDLKIIFRRWLESSMMDFDKLQAIELERLNELERTYWDAWERSCAEKEIYKREQIEDKTGARGTQQYSRDKATIEREKRDGDPRYLKGIMECIDKRCRLLGLENNIAGTGRDWRVEAAKAGYGESAGEIYDQLVGHFLQQDSELGGYDGSGGVGGSAEDQEEESE